MRTKLFNFFFSNLFVRFAFSLAYDRVFSMMKTKYSHKMGRSKLQRYASTVSRVRHNENECCLDSNQFFSLSMSELMSDNVMLINWHKRLCIYVFIQKSKNVFGYFCQRVISNIFDFCLCRLPLAHATKYLFVDFVLHEIQVTDGMLETNILLEVLLLYSIIKRFLCRRHRQTFNYISLFY